MQQSASDRDALLRGSAQDGGGGGGTSGNPEPRLTSEQLMTKTKDETKTQDDLLDVMSRGLDGLKALGMAIRDETDLQVTLLGHGGKPQVAKPRFVPSTGQLRTISLAAWRTRHVRSHVPEIVACSRMTHAAG